MAMIDWRIQGLDLNCCNCDWGCPCQFSSTPTRGHCQAAVIFHVDSGHFGSTSLDGLNFGGIFAWPKAIHEGNGEAQPIVDERANAQQRQALLKIMTGEETEPGATIFNVFAPTFTTVHEPVFPKIEFELDVDKRRGHFRIPGLVEAQAEPLRNPVTGIEQRARLVLPDGFEFIEAEIASSTVKTTGSPVGFAWEGRHSHVCRIDMTGKGLVRY